MACSNTHSARVQGAGVCCSHVGVDLTKPASGTTLPPYQPGGVKNASFMNSIPHVMVTNSLGQCGTCMIVGSRSAKHPGVPVLKFVRGGPGCPSSSHGCCALTS